MLTKPGKITATQAAIEAGYSARTAAQQASRLLKNVNVRRAIEGGLEEQRKRHQVDRDWLIQRLIAIIDFDPSGMIEVSSQGGLVLKQGGDQSALKYFKKLKVQNSKIGKNISSERIQFEMPDTLAAMKFLAELLGLIPAKQEMRSQGDSSQERVEQRLFAAVLKHSERIAS